MRDSAETVVNRVLEPGEKILWTGRPHVETALDQHAQRRRRGRLLAIGIFILAAPWLLSRTVFPSLSAVFEEVGLEPRFVVPIVVVLALIILPRMFKVDPKSRLHRYFNSLTYAITTERLLILEADKVYDAYTPEQVRSPRIRERAPGYSDVNFDERDRHRADGTISKDDVLRERRHAGFKSLPNAQEMKQRIDDWLQDHHTQAAREVADFVPAASKKSKLDQPKGGIRIVERSLGLELSAPEEWEVQVRAKKKPQGKIFIDKENWHALGEPESWNLVRIEGPSKCRVEIEIFETPPTVTFEKLANSRLADSISGPVIDKDSDCEINGLRGFSVTRRNDLEVNQQYNEVGIAAVVAPERHTVLHDGKRQVYVISTWPEDSEDLQRAVDTVVESIEVG
jgi:hypothetical protein